MAIASWIFGSLLLVFLLVVFWFGPKNLPRHKKRILAFISSLLAGLSFLTGDILLAYEADLGLGGKLGIQAVGGVALFVLVLLWWWSDFGPLAKKEDENNGGSSSAVNLDARTRDHSPVQQTALGHVTAETVDASSHHGLDGKDIASVVGTVMEKSAIQKALLDQNLQLSQEKEELQGQLAHAPPSSEENEELKKQLAAATPRADGAERRALPDARGIVQELRESGDTERLLKFLIDRRQVLQDEAVAINREIAAVAYLRGEVDTAESALNEILQQLPDDLDALNRMGHIHRLRGRLTDAEAAFNRVLALARDRNDEAAQAVATGNLGLIYQTRGELDKAEEMYRKSLEINERLGRQEGMATQNGKLGLIY